MRIFDPLNEDGITRLREAAKRGDAEAQYELANRHLFGDQVKWDREEAMNLYRKSAEQGNEKAQKRLDWYERFLAEAEKGDADKQVDIGAYFCEPGLETDDFDCHMALKWYCKAAALGNKRGLAHVRYCTSHCYMSKGRDWLSSLPSDVKVLLGDTACPWCCEYGPCSSYHTIGIEIQGDDCCPFNFEDEADCSLAEELYREEAERGNVRGMLRLGECLLCQEERWEEENLYVSYQKSEEGLTLSFEDDRETVWVLHKKWMSPMLREWFLKAPDQANHVPSNDLRYLLSWDAYAEAKEWLFKAAEQGDPMAMKDIGDLFLDGRGTQADFLEAVKWYREAEEHGYCDEDGYELYKMRMKEMDKCLRELYRSDGESCVDWYGKGLDCCRGNGVEQDCNMAAVYFKRAADKGNEDAGKALRSCHTSCPIGKEILADKRSAKIMDFYRKAAEAGNTDAQIVMCKAYFYGHGVERDVEEALKWYFRATGEYRNEQR